MVAHVRCRASRAPPGLPRKAGGHHEVSAWFALVAPAGTPRDVIERLNRETRTGLASREVQEAIAGHGIDPVSGSPEELAAQSRRVTLVPTRIPADTLRHARSVPQRRGRQRARCSRS